MKLIISLLVTVNVFAGHIIQINHSNNIEKAKYIKDYLNRRYQVPTHLIKIVSTACLDDASDKILQMCIESDGDLNFEQKNSELVSSLRIFNRPY